MADVAQEPRSVTGVASLFSREGSGYFWTAWGSLLVLLILTNHWGEQLVTHGDSMRYSTMALASPHLPDVNAVREFNSSYTQRFVVPYLVGFWRWVTGWDLAFCFRIGVVAILFAFTAAYRKVAWFSGITVNGAFTRLVAFAVLLNPYVFRHYLLWPELLHELVFVLGTLLICLGVVGKRRDYWVSGFIIATVGRQTVVMLFPAFALMLMIDTLSWRRRFQDMIFALTACVLTFWAIFEVSQTFTTTTIYGSILKNSLTGLLYWILDFFHGSREYYRAFVVGASFDAQNFDFYTQGQAFASEKPRISELIEFLARNSIPVLVPLLGTLVLLFKRRRFETWREIFTAPRAFLIAAAFMICLQPLLLGPYGGGSHNAKYCSYAVAPLSVLWLSLSQGFEMSRRTLSLLLATLFIASFHHVYSIWGGTQADAKKFAVLYFACAGIAGVFFAKGCTFKATAAPTSP
jgi:hypothetical protein